MKKYNDGLIYTNDDCIACNKCISNCSLIGANVAITKNGKNNIQVNGKKCNSCGRCLNTCYHNAREYRDDTELFTNELKSNEKISVIIDPSFFVFFGERAVNVLGYLKSIGVEKIYDGIFGAEINIWSTIDFIKKDQKNPLWQRRFLSANCSSFVNMVEMYYPELFNKLMPVHSPMACTAIYVRKYLKDNNKLAFLGPCITKKIEIDWLESIAEVNYNVTYKNLLALIGELDISKMHASLDLESIGFGYCVAFPNGIGNFISNFFTKDKLFLNYVGIASENVEIVRGIRKLSDETQLPLYVNVTLSRNCAECTGVGLKNNKPIDIYKNLCYVKSSKYNSLLDECSLEEKNYKLEAFFSQLNIEDFCNRKFTDKYHQPYHVPESTMEEVFNAMLKTIEPKRNINCGSCGYKSCHDMATAIAYGFNKKENCIHYMNDLMEMRFNFDRDTGLLARPSFIRAAKELIYMNPGKAYVVFIGDINRFKVINDIYSFDVGTQALKVIANTLRGAVGDKGLCGRMGGGTFALCFEYNPENMQRFRAIKSFDCSSLNIKIPVTMRFGAYIVQNELIEDLTIVMNWATLSMDKNISETKNTITMFTQEYRDRMFKEARVAAMLQPALDANEFTLWFQPQYLASSGELVGAEALCRWIKPDGTIVSPGLFIPLSEKNGFIKQLDKEIWKMAFRSIRNWLDEGLEPVPISVNISRISLQSDELIYVIRRLHEEYKVPENLIHFEITESAYMGELNLLIDRINKIRDMGYKIAMDDFGSGYSSLNTLKDLPIDILKLDMGFLRDQTNMNKGGTIIGSIIRMAQSLELNTIAEGVETAEQAAFLNRVGCDIIQGYIYAKQMPEDRFKEVMKSERKRILVSRPRIFGKIDALNLYDFNSVEYMMFEEFSGPAAIIEYDELTKIPELVRCNEEGLRLFGIEKRSFIEVRQLFNDYSSKQYNDLKFALALEQVTHGQDKVSCVVEGMNYRTETPIWLKVHMKEISVSNQKHILYFLLDDITDEKITESTLSISNSQMSLLFDNAQIGMCLMNFKVDFRRFKETLKIRVIRCNQQFVDMTGFKEEEILNWTEKETMSVIHPLDRPGFIAKVIKEFLCKEKRPFSYVYRAKKADGKYYKVKIMITGVQQPDKSYLLVTNYALLDDKKEEQ